MDTHVFERCGPLPALAGLAELFLLAVEIGSPDEGRPGTCRTPQVEFDLGQQFLALTVADRGRTHRRVDQYRFDEFRSLLGPTLTALLMQHYSDHLLFMVIAGVSLVYLLMLLRKMGEHPTPMAHA